MLETHNGSVFEHNPALQVADEDPQASWLRLPAAAPRAGGLSAFLSFFFFLRGGGGWKIRRLQLRQLPGANDSRHFTTSSFSQLFA